MPSTASVTDPVDADDDWDMAAGIAESLGRATLLKLAQRNVDDIQKWCLRMAGTMTGEFNAPRALSYLELAVAVGYRSDETVDHARRDCAELLQRAKDLAQETKLLVKAVELKVKEQEDATKAEAEAKAKAEAEAEAKARAEEDAEPEDDGTDAAATEVGSDTSSSPAGDEQPDLYEAEKDPPW